MIVGVAGGKGGYSNSNTLKIILKKYIGWIVVNKVGRIPLKALTSNSLTDLSDLYYPTYPT